MGSSAPTSILEGFNEIKGQKTFQNRVKNTFLPNRGPVFTPLHPPPPHLLGRFLPFPRLKCKKKIRSVHQALAWQLKSLI